MGESRLARSDRRQKVRRGVLRIEPSGFRRKARHFVRWRRLDVIHGDRASGRTLNMDMPCGLRRPLWPDAPKARATEIECIENNN